MILIPKYKEIYTKSPITLDTSIGAEYQITMRDANGRFLYETEWRSNLITNIGLDAMGAAAGLGIYVYVGSDGTAANYTDTSLGANLLATGKTGTIDGGANAGAPNYGIYYDYIFRFNAGEATGTIQELGRSVENTYTPGTMNTRTIITPAVVKSADQIMDLRYRHWQYPSNVAVDTTGTIVIDTETYDYTIRANRVGQTAASVCGLQNIYQLTRAYGTDSALLAVTADLINTATTKIVDSGTTSYAAYTPGTYYRDGTLTWEVDDGNFDFTNIAVDVSGYATTTSGSARSAGYQVHFANTVGGTGIPKTSDNELTITLRRSWSRHP